MSIHDQNFYFQAAMGIKGMKAVNKFGYGDIADKAVAETVWANGGIYDFPTSAGQVSIASSDVDDDDGDTGARTVLVQGLDEDYREIEETITLNGTGTVTSTSSKWFRVNRMLVASAGTSEGNEGTITATLDSKTVATIPAGKGQTQQAVYTVPAGRTAYLVSLSAALLKPAATGDYSADIGLHLKKDGVERTVRELAIVTTGSTSFLKEFKVPEVITEKTDIFVNIEGTSDDDLKIFANFSVVLL